ncbi:MAG: twin-arginine translocase TatA/TatE family subunit [Alphaproteobacteria bacterium]
MAPGAMQIIVVILLVMILFGAGRIPAIMENLAKGIKSFKKGLNDEDVETPKISSKDINEEE